MPYCLYRVRMKDSINIEFLGDLSLDGLYNDPQNFFGLDSKMSGIILNTDNQSINYILWIKH